MEITEIIVQKNNKSRCNIAIDGNYYCGVDASLIVELDLYKGKKIDDTYLNMICEAEIYQKCLNSALTIISIRMNSENEIKRKLKQRYPTEAINKVIERLKELKYIDDSFFVNEWIQSRKKDRGKLLIKKELLYKGINREIIDKQLLEYTYEQEVETAKTLIKKKKLKLLDKNNDYKSIYNFLSRKGFEHSVIKSAFE